MKKILLVVLAALMLAAFGGFVLGYVAGSMPKSEVKIERGAYGVIINGRLAGKEIML